MASGRSGSYEASEEHSELTVVSVVCERSGTRGSVELRHNQICWELSVSIGLGYRVRLCEELSPDTRCL